MTFQKKKQMAEHSTVVKELTMAVAIPSEIAKNFALCVRCGKVGRYLCERCGDSYCSKMCQALDWPIHRKICIAMPALLEIPYEGHMISMCDQRDALAYRTTSQNQYRPESRNNYGRMSVDNVPQMFGDQSFSRPIRKALCYSSYFQSIDSGAAQTFDLKKRGSPLDTQPRLPIAMQKSANRSNDTDEIINLATSIKSDCDVPVLLTHREKQTRQRQMREKQILEEQMRQKQMRERQNRDRQMPQKPMNWEEDIPDHIHDLERLMVNDSRPRQKPFAVDANTTRNMTPVDKTIQSTHQPMTIETILIPEGVPIELFCLDSSKIENGYIAACIHDTRKIESINQLSEKIMAYLEALGTARTGTYSAKLDELCFAFHPFDRQWYRAECIAVMGADQFEIMFVDYGTTDVVSSANLRKFSGDFLEPSIMHYCSMKDLPKESTKRVADKIGKYFQQNPIFPVASAQYDGNGILIIDCPKLLRYIS